MATAHFTTTYDHANATGEGALADGVLVGSSMFGAISGALIGAAATSGMFEYAAVLFGTLGVIMGAVVASTIGRMAILPALMAFARRQG